jgi:PAS domain S-box-containing protein
MSKERLNILVVEDNTGDFLIIQQMLNEIREFSKEIIHVTTLTESIKTIDQTPVDVILLDLSLPDSYGIDTFIRVQQRCPQIPILILSGLTDTKTAHDAVKNGAQEYLIKGEFDDKLLGKAIQYSIERNNSKELLRQSEETYKELFENNPIPMFIREKETFRILKVNQSAILQFGYTEEEFLEMSVLQLHPPEEQIFLRNQEQRGKLNYNHNRSFTHLKKDGSRVIVELKVRELVYHDRPCYLVLADDVTEKRKVQEEIIVQANILKNVRDTIFVTDVNGVITYWNEGAEQTFGYSRHEMIGETYERLFSEFDKYTFQPELTEILSGRLQQWESKLITHSEKIIWLDNKASVLKNDQNTVTGYIRVCKDVSQRKRFSEKQKETVATLNSIFNNVIQSIILLDKTARIKAFNQTANKQCIQLMGKELQENEDFLPYLLDEMKPLFTSQFNHALRGKQLQFEQAYEFSENSVHWYGVGMSPVADETGLILGVCVSMINITERKLADEKFKGQYLEIEQTNKELDKLVKILSHDLRAPMHSVNGLIALARDEKDPAQFVNYLNMMEKSLKRLEDFTNDIISSLKGHVKPVDRGVNLAIFVTELIDQLRFTAGAEDIEFKNEVSPGLNIYSQPTQLRIILSNLLSNAIKYHAPQKAEKQFVRITAEKLTGYLTIKVQDNGIGISDENKEKIFDSYFTLGTAGISNGLGLYNVKQAVAKLKGGITLESKVGEGSTFKVQLPDLHS